ncbi:MAG: gliding motility-associated C-terminal domain-containing protein [Bacteroidales bacterium]|jgi:PKD repeat protein|nr:gliding motility-associated C-terminal domain-containing protein [Bacteroidales bacterium]
MKSIHLFKSFFFIFCLLLFLTTTAQEEENYTLAGNNGEIVTCCNCTVSLGDYEIGVPYSITVCLPYTEVILSQDTVYNPNGTYQIITTIVHSQIHYHHINEQSTSIQVYDSDGQTILFDHYAECTEPLQISGNCFLINFIAPSEEDAIFDVFIDCPIIITSESGGGGGDGDGDGGGDGGGEYQFNDTIFIPEIIVSCIRPPEINAGRFLAEIYSTSPQTTIKDGILFVNTCWDEIENQSIPITFNARVMDLVTGEYFADSLILYQWNFGDNNPIDQGMGLNSVIHSYFERKEYDVILKTSIPSYCDLKLNDFYYKVRINLPPNINIDNTLICPGEPITICLAPSNYSAPRCVTLPTGISACYYSEIIYRDFEEGAVLTSVDDIIGIHTWLQHEHFGGLQISIICPNETSVMISEGRLRTNLGIPGSTCTCENDGVPFEYIIAENTAAPTMWYESIHFVDTELPEGIYSTAMPFSPLIGCPLNGKWTLKICDYSFNDCGVLSDWYIEFANGVSPSWLYSQEYSAPTFSANQGFETLFYDSINNCSTFTFYNTSTPNIQTIQPIHLDFVDDFGCPLETNFNITVRDIPACCALYNPFLDPGNTICGNSYTFTTNISTGNFGVWTCINKPAEAPLPIFENPNNPNTSVNIGNYYGEYIFSGNLISICDTITNIVVVNFYKPPTSDFVISPINCFSDIVDVTYTGNMTSSAEYLWDFGFCNIISGSGSGPYQISYPISNSYQISLTINNNICSSYSVQNIFNPPQLGFSLDFPEKICYQICNGYATANAFGGTPPYSYSWNIPNSETNNIENLCPNLYSLTITDNNSCTSSQSFQILENSIINLNNSTFTNVNCNNQNDGTIIVIIEGGSSPYYYNWNDNNSSFARNNLQIGNYFVTVTDKYNCSAVANFTITQPPKFTYATFSDSTKCYGSADGYAAITPAGGTMPYSYLWYDGTTDSSINLPAGNYIVTVYDANHCKLTANFNIGQPVPLYSTPIENSTICYGQNVFLITETTGGTPPYDYHWSDNQGNEYFNNSWALNPTQTTEFSVTVSDHNNCQFVINPITITVNPAIQIISVVPEKILICPGEDDIIRVNIIGGNGGPYMMRLQDGRIVGSPFIVNPMETTWYYITVEDMCGSPTAKDSVLIEVRPNPNIEFTASVLKGCPPLTVEFTDHSEMKFINYFWTFGDNNFSKYRNTEFTYYESGIYDVIFEVTDTAGCVHRRVAKDLITVYPKPHSIFSYEPENITVVNPEIKFKNLSIGATKYLWSFGDGDSAEIKTPLHHYLPNIDSYNVCLITENNFYCLDTSCREIIVEDILTFYMPTSFTPDGDGINDFVKPCGHFINPRNFRFSISDRFGNIIFETDKYLEAKTAGDCSENSEGAWNGKKYNRGNVLQNGVYVWHCTFEDMYGTFYEKAGEITLLR